MGEKTPRASIFCEVCSEEDTCTFTGEIDLSRYASDDELREELENLFDDAIEQIATEWYNARSDHG